MKGMRLPLRLAMGSTSVLRSNARPFDSAVPFLNRVHRSPRGQPRIQHHAQLSLPWHHQQRRMAHGNSSALARANISKAMARMNNAAKNPAMPKDMQRTMLSEMRIPGTFVPLRPSERPKEWQPWLEYHFEMYRRRAVSFLSRVALWAHAVEQWSDYFYLRSRLKLDTFQLAATARDLHSSFGKAVAAADTEQLRSMCTRNLYQNLVNGALANRNPREILRWALVGTPRVKVVAHDVVPIGAVMFQQVITAIDSTQQLSRFRAKERTPVSGGVTERQMQENFVILREIDPHTYVNGEWKIWGTIPGTKLKEFLATKRALEQRSKDDIRQKHPELFKRPKVEK